MTALCGEGTRGAEACDEGSEERNEGSTVKEKQRGNGAGEQEDGEEDNEVWNEERDKMSAELAGAVREEKHTERGKGELPSRHRARRQCWGVVSLLQDQTAAHNA